jgi:hypothetical protein
MEPLRFDLRRPRFPDMNEICIGRRLPCKMRFPRFVHRKSIVFVDLWQVEAFLVRAAVRLIRYKSSKNDNPRAPFVFD